MFVQRRDFFRFVAASTVLAPLTRSLAQQTAGAGDGPNMLRDVNDALQIMDFEEPARRALPPAHWGYLAGGVDDDLTLRANVEGFRHFGLRPRNLVDVSKLDMSVEVFGQRWDTPLYMCPVSSQRAFSSEGEIASAAAAKAKRHQIILSNFSTYSVEDVAKVLGHAPWQQLYIPQKWDETERLVKRIEDAGVSVLVWTIDNRAGRNIPTQRRFFRQDGRDCLACHTNGVGTHVPGLRPMYEDLGLSGLYNPLDATWTTLERLKKLTSMRVIVKGIDTAEDAQLALQHGVDGLVVSNHGGRATETQRATIDCLSEVIDAVGGRVPVFLDGGVRHGTDIYKALALGAKGVGIGRPYVWGLATFGQMGVEKVLDILRSELALTMRQMGTPTVDQITKARVARL